MQLLIDLMRSNGKADDDKFYFNEIAALAFVFYAVCSRDQHIEGSLASFPRLQSRYSAEKKREKG